MLRAILIYTCLSLLIRASVQIEKASGGKTASKRRRRRAQKGGGKGVKRPLKNAQKSRLDSGGGESSTKSSRFFFKSTPKTVKSSRLDSKIPFSIYNIKEVLTPRVQQTIVRGSGGAWVHSVPAGPPARPSRNVDHHGRRHLLSSPPLAPDCRVCPSKATREVYDA